MKCFKYLVLLVLVTHASSCIDQKEEMKKNNMALPSEPETEIFTRELVRK